MSNLRLQIKNTEDTCDLGDLLDSIDDNNLNDVIDLFPELLKHKSWLIRSDILEIIRGFQLKQFVPYLLDVLDGDKKMIVVRDALLALYDIDRWKALPILKEYVSHKDVSIRIAVYSLLYVEFKKAEYLEKLSKILLRRNCNYYHKGVFYHIMTDYLDIEDCPEVITLLKEVLKVTDPEYGIAKDIAEYLRKITIQV